MLVARSFAEVSSPEGRKHGTAIQMSHNILDGLLQNKSSTG
jgi:hypothetical protein